MAGNKQGINVSVFWDEFILRDGYDTGGTLRTALLHATDAIVDNDDGTYTFNFVDGSEVTIGANEITGITFNQTTGVVTVQHSNKEDDTFTIPVILSAAANDDGTITFTFNTGHQITTTGSLIGPQGAQGVSQFTVFQVAATNNPPTRPNPTVFELDEDFAPANGIPTGWTLTPDSHDPGESLFAITAITDPANDDPDGDGNVLLTWSNVFIAGSTGPSGPAGVSIIGVDVPADGVNEGHLVINRDQGQPDIVTTEVVAGDKNLVANFAAGQLTITGERGDGTPFQYGPWTIAGVTGGDAITIYSATVEYSQGHLVASVNGSNISVYEFNAVVAATGVPLTDSRWTQLLDSSLLALKSETLALNPTEDQLVIAPVGTKTILRGELDFEDNNGDKSLDFSGTSGDFHFEHEDNVYVLFDKSNRKLYYDKDNTTGTLTTSDDNEVMNAGGLEIGATSLGHVDHPGSATEDAQIILGYDGRVISRLPVDVIESADAGIDFIQNNTNGRINLVLSDTVQAGDNKPVTSGAVHSALTNFEGSGRGELAWPDAYTADFTVEVGQVWRDGPHRYRRRGAAINVTMANFADSTPPLLGDVGWQLMNSDDKLDQYPLIPHVTGTTDMTNTINGHTIDAFVLTANYTFDGIEYVPGLYIWDEDDDVWVRVSNQLEEEGIVWSAEVGYGTGSLVTYEVGANWRRFIRTGANIDADVNNPTPNTDGSGWVEIVSSNEITGVEIQRNSAGQTEAEYDADTDPGKPATFVADDDESLTYIALARDMQLLENDVYSRMIIATENVDDYHFDLLAFKAKGGRVVLQTEALVAALALKLDLVTGLIGTHNGAVEITGTAPTDNDAVYLIDTYTDTSGANDVVYERGTYSYVTDTWVATGGGGGVAGNDTRFTGAPVGAGIVTSGVTVSAVGLVHNTLGEPQTVILPSANPTTPFAIGEHVHTTDAAGAVTYVIVDTFVAASNVVEIIIDGDHRTAWQGATDIFVDRTATPANTIFATENAGAGALTLSDSLINNIQVANQAHALALENEAKIDAIAGILTVATAWETQGTYLTTTWPGLITNHTAGQANSLYTSPTMRVNPDGTFRFSVYASFPTEDVPAAFTDEFGSEGQINKPLTGIAFSSSAYDNAPFLHVLQSEFISSTPLGTGGTAAGYGGRHVVVFEGSLTEAQNNDRTFIQNASDVFAIYGEYSLYAFYPDNDVYDNFRIGDPAAIFAFTEGIYALHELSDNYRTGSIDYQSVDNLGTFADPPTLATALTDDFVTVQKTYLTVDYYLRYQNYGTGNTQTRVLLTTVAEPDVTLYTHNIT